MVVNQPQSTRVKEPTLLCNQVVLGADLAGRAEFRDSAESLLAFVHFFSSLDDL